MDKSKYFTEEGIRCFYNENGTLIKKEGFSKMFRIKDKQEEQKDQDRETYIKELLQANIDQSNKVSFLSNKVYKLQKENAELKKVID